MIFVLVFLMLGFKPAFSLFQYQGPKDRLDPGDMLLPLQFRPHLLHLCVRHESTPSSTEPQKVLPSRPRPPHTPWLRLS